jgi:hypothetical protein
MVASGSQHNLTHATISCLTNLKTSPQSTSGDLALQKLSLPTVAVNHEQVNVVLDEEFIEAWIHGIIISCHDGILRRFYPRIFTHSADYLEK